MDKVGNVLADTGISSVDCDPPTGMRSVNNGRCVGVQTGVDKHPRVVYLLKTPAHFLR